MTGEVRTAGVAFVPDSREIDVSQTGYELEPFEPTEASKEADTIAAEWSRLSPAKKQALYSGSPALFAEAWQEKNRR